MYNLETARTGNVILLTILEFQNGNAATIHTSAAKTFKRNYLLVEHEILVALRFVALPLCFDVSLVYLERGWHT